MKTKWTKKAIKTLQQQIESFVLANRMYAPPVAISAKISEHRKDVVLSGLRAFRDLLASRAAENEKTARHFEANPNIYRESTPEMVTRFEALAQDGQKAVSVCDELIARVESEGLPPEVVAYVPSCSLSEVR